MHKAKAVTSRLEQSAGVAATRATPKTFQFVDANPTTDAERSQNKILVRSNASNFHWRRVKKSSDSPTGRGSSRKRPPNNEPPNPSRRVIAPTNHTTSETSSYTESEHSPIKNEEDQASRQGTESPAGSDGRAEPTRDLLSLIGSGHYDPFEMYPSDLPKEFVSPVLHQSEYLSLFQGGRDFID